MEIREVASDAELKCVFELCAVAFEGVPAEYFNKSVRNDPDWQPWQTRCLFEGGELVASVQLFHREICMNRRWVRCAGIGNVATHPSFRTRGYASALMRDALHQAKIRGYAVSLLFTGIQPFYRRFDFRDLHWERHQLQVRASCRRPSVREVCPADWQAIRQLHAAHALDHPVIVRRDERRWDAIDASAISNKPRWIVQTAGGEVASYVRVDEIDGIWRITEYVVTGGVSAFDAMLEWAAQHLGVSSIIVDTCDPEGVVRGSRYHAGKGELREIMMAVIDERQLADQGGFDSPPEALKYVNDLAQNGVEFWRTDFF